MVLWEVLRVNGESGECCVLGKVVDVGDCLCWVICFTVLSANSSYAAAIDFYFLSLFLFLIVLEYFRRKLRKGST